MNTSVMPIAQAVTELASSVSELTVQNVKSVPGLGAAHLFEVAGESYATLGTETSRTISQIEGSTNLVAGVLRETSDGIAEAFPTLDTAVLAPATNMAAVSEKDKSSSRLM